MSVVLYASGGVYVNYKETVWFDLEHPGDLTPFSFYSEELEQLSCEPIKLHLDIFCSSTDVSEFYFMEEGYW